jgi:SAM-dependent methyltransferase
VTARAFFDAIARRYDREYALSGALSRERLARVLALIEGRRRVLVLGIGTGRELPALLDAGHEVRAIEISSEMIALCNQRSRRVPITEGDFYAPLPFANASFAAVLALHGTLAHPPHARAHSDLAKEIARVLDGVLIAEVPSEKFLAVAQQVTGKAEFVHRDERTQASLAGIALDAAGWQAAFAPLAVEATPLGDLEYLLVARTVKSI